MRIYNLGSLNIDYVYAVDHFVQAGETLSSREMRIFPGGKGLNQSIATARAGAKVYHAGCIGNDGDMLRNELIGSGVDVSYLRTVDSRNGHAMIQVSNSGENNIVLYSGSNGMVTKEFIDEVLEDFSDDDLVLLQNEISNMAYVIEKAYRKGMRIVLNPAPFDDALKKIDLDMLSCVILNEVEAMGFTGKTEPEEVIALLRNRYPKLTVVLTLGKKGCIYADEKQTLYQNAFRVEAVDTTGAGDAFLGAILYRLKDKTLCEIADLTTDELDDILDFANASGSLTTTKTGAAPSIPTLEEIAECRKTVGKLK